MVAGIPTGTAHLRVWYGPIGRLRESLATRRNPFRLQLMAYNWYMALDVDRQQPEQGQRISYATELSRITTSKAEMGNVYGGWKEPWSARRQEESTKVAIGDNSKS